jgi:GntR family phosphonate transport system transcriptional regulator
MTSPAPPRTDVMPPHGRPALLVGPWALRDDRAQGPLPDPATAWPSVSDLATPLRRPTADRPCAWRWRGSGARGLVASRRGAGHLCASRRPTDYPKRPTRPLHRKHPRLGRTPSAPTSLPTRAADAGEAEALALPPARPSTPTRASPSPTASPSPCSKASSPPTASPDLPRHLAATPPSRRRSAACGVSRLRPRLHAPRGHARHRAPSRALAPAQPAALLRSTHLNADPEGRPVELGTTWFAGDRVALVLADSEASRG